MTQIGATGSSVEAAETATRTRDSSVSWKVFLGVGTFIAVLAVVYWFSSYEDAGTTMLALASGLALFFGSFLFVQDRRQRLGLAGAHPIVARVEATSGGAAERSVEDEDEAVDHGHYLPQSSVWPLAMGVGAAMTLNGLIIGWPYATPGAAFLALAVGGFVAQGRRRG
jgi:hypothetical protein